MKSFVKFDIGTSIRSGVITCYWKIQNGGQVDKDAI